MGNRAVITTAPFNKNNVGIYVHWNGGQESVAAFVEAARKLGYRDPISDNNYGMARLCQLIGLFFGADESTSLGIGKCSDLDCDNGDNGVWLIGHDWTITGQMDRRTLKRIPISPAATQSNMDIVERIMVATKAASDAVKADA